METYTQASGRMTKPMVMASTLIIMVQDMRDIGKMTIRKGTEWKNGLMAANMMVAISKVEKMVKAPTHGLTEATIKLTDMEFTVGLTGESMKVNGLTTRCMDVGFIFGKMVENMRANTSKTRRMASEHTPGLTEKNTLVNGAIANVMAKVHLL
jgi:hypothetical protein